MRLKTVPTSTPMMPRDDVRATMNDVLAELDAGLLAYRKEKTVNGW